MTILWWHWLVLGLLLAGAELATPGGFYLIFFGLAAIAVGLLAAVGLAGPLPLQIVLFAVLALVSLALFRSRLLKWLQANPQSRDVDSLIGEIAVASEDIAAGAIGKVELRGSAWSARNGSSVALKRGTRTRVLRVDGLLLTIEPEGAWG